MVAGLFMGSGAPMSACQNGCGRDTTMPSERFCRGCVTAPPRVHPMLLDAAYLEACSLEIELRRSTGSAEIMRRVVEDAWNLARGLCTKPTELLTSGERR
jgi:hypothetical protein